MLKHIGKHNSKKIVVLWREVPNEGHMCLVAYSDHLPRIIHDELMTALESAIGQNAKDLSDVCFRTVMSDGRNLLGVMHTSGLIKKIPTNQVLMTPTAKSSVRLDELNSILNEMEQGEAAIKRLSDLDKNAGMQMKKRVREGREVGMPPNNNSLSRTNVDSFPTDDAATYVTGALSNADLALQRQTQADALKSQATQLLAEAARLDSEASQLNPPKNVKTPKTKKVQKPEDKPQS